MSCVLDIVQPTIGEKEPENYKYSLGVTLKIKHYFGCKEIAEKLVEKSGRSMACSRMSGKH